MTTIKTDGTSRIRFTLPPCTIGITVGSERGDYVGQSHMLERIGRPHHVVNLMFQYYPDLKGWPTQGVKWHGFYRNPNLNKGDGYFPLVLEPGGPWGQLYLRQIEDVRAHGQEPQLTLTLHADTPDADLIRIAKALAPYGRMRIRINHECNGVWFYFNQRWSYREVSDFFIRFHGILHEHAPEARTVACWNGVGENYREPGGPLRWGRLTDDQLGPMFRMADIISYDQYASLHYGWPNPDFNPERPDEYFRVPFDIWWDLLDNVHRDMCELRGEDVDIEIHEINEDADIVGYDGQAEWVTRFYREAAQRAYPWLTNITFYMFRDRGGLGLEKEDVDDPSAFEALPSLAAYREAIRDPRFALRIEAGSETDSRVMRWTSTMDAEGLRFALPRTRGALRIQLPKEDNLLLGIGGRWKIKKPGTGHVDFEHAADGTALDVFAPPPDGKNNTQGAFETVLEQSPVFDVLEDMQPLEVRS